MSPEHLEAKETDARSDIFALGSLLYEMTTGQKAFTGKSQASLIAAILSAEPVRLASVHPMALWRSNDSPLSLAPGKFADLSR